MPVPTEKMVAAPPPLFLLQPCVLPPFTVSYWGDYPQYVELMRAAMKKCNMERSAFLSSPSIAPWLARDKGEAAGILFNRAYDTAD